jgi:hypothetical protein
MVAYLADCTLATVCLLATNRSRQHKEFARQINIAQLAIDWMQRHKVDMANTRAADVVALGSVTDWAVSFMSKEPHANNLDICEAASNLLRPAATKQPPKNK